MPRPPSPRAGPLPAPGPPETRWPPWTTWPRHAGAANSIQDTDPSAALSEVAQGEPLVAQAQTLAEADVRQSGSWGSDSGAGGGQGRGGGLDVGSLVLGGLLMGGLSGGHHGGWGGPDLDFDFFD